MLAVSSLGLEMLVFENLAAMDPPRDLLTITALYSGRSDSAACCTTLWCSLALHSAIWASHRRHCEEF